MNSTKLLSVFILLMFVISNGINAQVYVSQNFVDVITAATQRYVHGKEWTKYMNDIGFMFPGDDACRNGIEFPAHFNFTGRNLNLCYEKSADSTRMVFNNLAAKLLVQTIQSQYPATHSELNGTMIPIDITNGIFEAMRDGVNTGVCDVVIAAVNWVEERKSQVTLLCPYAASGAGFIRSEKDNSTISIANEKEMDKSGVIVSVLTKSTYETWAKSNLKFATIVSYPSFESGWQSILNLTSHTFLYNSNVIYSRLRDLKAQKICQSCYLKVYGDITPFSSFMSKQILNSGAISTNSWILWKGFFFILVIFLFHFVIGKF